MTYLKYPLPSKGLGKDLVVWWKDNERMFPLLGMVARRIMSVQSTSAEAERDFSAAGFVTSKCRLGLSWESVNICTFCSLNSGYIPKDAPNGFVG